MKKFLSTAKNALPAIIVIIVLLVCAAMPELGVIPDLLTSEVDAQETEADSDEDELIVQAVGDYEDGVYTGSATGYGGTITVEVTVEGGQIVSIEILEHSGETDSFYSRAVAVIDSIILYQTWEVDAISGATYSSNGIKNAVKNALTGEVTESETAESSSDSDALEDVEYEDPDGYVDGTYTGSATGFGGLITVSVTISGGVITSIEIVDASGETAEYLSSALAVIDSILSAQSPNVDAVSGATYSSNGIINAVKAALSQAVASPEDSDESDSLSESGSSSSEETSAADLSDLPNYGYTDGTYTGSATGYGGEVIMSVTIEGGQITDISVVSAEGETYSYWNQALALVDEIIAAQTTDGIDAVSGATFSSNGIINAVKAALEEAAGSDDGLSDDGDSGTGSEDSSDASDGEDSSDASADSDEDTLLSLPNYGYEDGTYVGSATGYGGDVILSITIEGGYITDIEVVSAEGETYAYWVQALTLIDEILAAQTTDGIDAVSGATFSSNGIINAVKAALEEAAGTEDDELSEDGDGDSDSADSSDDSQALTDSDEEDTLLNLPNYGYEDGTYVGSATGYGGDVILSITIEGGYITDIEVVSAEGETYAYWVQALTLIDEILAAQTTDGIDAVSGATFSSNGIINAVKAALEDALSSEEDEDDGSSDGGDGSSSDGGDGSSSDADVDEEQDSEEEENGIDFSSLPNYGYIDGTYTGTGYGYGGDVVITVTVEGGQITALEVVSAEGETYAYWSQAVALLDTIILAQTWEVDAVSGATFSSEGIMDAVADALADAVAQAQEETQEDSDSSGSEGETSDDESPDADGSGDEQDSLSDPDDGSGDTDSGEEGGSQDGADGDEETETEAEAEAETGGSTDTQTPESTEPVTETDVSEEVYSYTFTVYPDEDEDFDAYEVTIYVTVEITTVTVTDGDALTISVTSEILSAEYEADTDSTNLRYLSKAWTKLIDSLLAGEDVDAVSGATCSSTALIEIWEEITADINPGQEQTTQETVSAEASLVIAEEKKNYASTEVIIKKEDDE